MKLIKISVDFNPNYYINPNIIESIGCDYDRDYSVRFTNKRTFHHDKSFICVKGWEESLKVNCSVEELIKLIEEA